VNAEIAIRQAQRADRSALLFFHRELYMRYRREITPASLEAIYAYRDLEAALRDDIDALLHRRGTLIYLAERGDEPCGYITGHTEHDARRVLSGKGVVEDWFVLEAWRGKGVGRRLIQTLLDQFRTLGCQVAESATWPFNTPGRQAHLSEGFEEVEIRFRRKL